MPHRRCHLEAPSAPELVPLLTLGGTDLWGQVSLCKATHSGPSPGSCISGFDAEPGSPLLGWVSLCRHTDCTLVKSVLCYTPGFSEGDGRNSPQVQSPWGGVFSFSRRHERGRWGGPGLDLTQRWVEPSHGRIQGRKRGGRPPEGRARSLDARLGHGTGTGAAVRAAGGRCARHASSGKGAWKALSVVPGLRKGEPCSFPRVLAPAGSAAT